jgi:hypothetical protein
VTVGSLDQPVELGRRGHKGVARFGHIAVAVLSVKEGSVGASVSRTAILRHVGGEAEGRHAQLQEDVEEIGGRAKVAVAHEERLGEFGVCATGRF